MDRCLQKQLEEILSDEALEKILDEEPTQESTADKSEERLEAQDFDSK